MNPNNIMNGIDFYIASSCNLNCNYCTISKNKSLHKIDEMIKKSLYNDEYLNLTKKIWNGYEDKLLSIDLWGGEPTIGLPWFIDNMDKFFLYFPNLSKVFLSTNLVYSEGIENLNKFMINLNKYNRKITFRLQISIDGPEMINDMGRGNGVTAKFIENFKRLLDLDVLSNQGNIKLIISTKPTLSNETLRLLDTKDKILEYYKFFENELYLPYLNHKNRSNVVFRLSIPNFAQPGTYTTNDGKLFSQFIKNSIELTMENPIKQHFIYFNDIVLFSDRSVCSSCDAMMGGFCGALTSKLSILPNNKITICHRAFTDTLDNYVNEYFDDATLKDKPIFTDINIKDHHNITKMDLSELNKVTDHISYFYDNHHRHFITAMKAAAPLLLEAGQIDEMYQDPSKLMDGIDLILSNCVCIYDNIVLNGSLIIPPFNNMKLFMNGAADQIIEFMKGRGSLKC